MQCGLEEKYKAKRLCDLNFMETKLSGKNERQTHKTPKMIVLFLIKKKIVSKTETTGRQPLIGARKNFSLVYETSWYVSCAYHAIWTPTNWSTSSPQECYDREG